MGIGQQYYYNIYIYSYIFIPYFKVFNKDSEYWYWIYSGILTLYTIGTVIYNYNKGSEGQLLSMLGIIMFISYIYVSHIYKS